MLLKVEAKNKGVVRRGKEELEEDKPLN